MSPPGLSQNSASKDVCSQVASPGCAAVPLPPGAPASEAPSPHAPAAGTMFTVTGPAPGGTVDTCIVSRALLITAPTGNGLTSNLRRPRLRLLVNPVRP